MSNESNPMFSSRSVHPALIPTYRRPSDALLPQNHPSNLGSLDRRYHLRAFSALGTPTIATAAAGAPWNGNSVASSPYLHA
mmetsp:Transcript_27971/g.64031  ORF Transcript_27971/g.64031 Transcript_27971/m.64031 type:complete len:81 (+) Transcript_27971:97-339(+)